MSAEHKTVKLDQNALGLVGAALVGVVIMAPSLALYGNWSPMVTTVGTRGALVFLIALIMTVPTAYSYSVLASRDPNAGSVFSWVSRFVNPRAGAVSGYSAAIYYMLLAAFEPPLIASVFLNLVGVHSTALFIIVTFGVLALLVPVAYAGISIDMGTAGILVLIEAGIVTVVVIAAYVKLPTAHLSLQPLSLSGITRVALLQALILGVLSFTGYDAVSTVAEETRTPRKLIPRATLLSAAVIGVFWIVFAILLAGAMPPAEYSTAIAAGGNALSFLGERSMGTLGRVLIDLMALEAGLAITLVSIVGSSRIVYAMGRQGLAPRAAANVNSKSKSPRTAVAIVVGVAVVSILVASAFVGWSFDIYLWLANILVFFALVVYIFVNVTHIVYFLRYHRSEFNVFLNGLVPVLGAAIAAYYLYSAFFHALWNAGFRLGRSTVIASLVVFAVVVLVSVLLPSSRLAARESVAEVVAAEAAAEASDLAAAQASE